MPAGVASMLVCAFAITTPALADADQEAAAKRLENALVSPCCWSQTVALHHSPEAVQIKEDIRARLALGEAPAAILESYVAMHGTRILSRPPAVGFHRLLYGLPPAFLGLTAVLLILYGRVLSRRRARADASPEAPVPAAPLDEALRERLDDELELYD